MKLQDIKRSEHSTQGLWWDFERGQRCDAPTDKLCVKIAERDNPMHRACLARLQLDAADKLRQGGEAATLAWNKIQVRAMAEAILVDWANVDAEDGSPIPYSVAEAERVLADPALWPFRNFIEDAAGLARGYRLQQEADAKGN